MSAKNKYLLWIQLCRRPKEGTGIPYHHLPALLRADQDIIGGKNAINAWNINGGKGPLFFPQFHYAPPSKNKVKLRLFKDLQGHKEAEVIFLDNQVSFSA